VFTIHIKGIFINFFSLVINGLILIIPISTQATTRGWQTGEIYTYKIITVEEIITENTVQSVVGKNVVLRELVANFNITEIDEESKIVKIVINDNVVLVL